MNSKYKSSIILLYFKVVFYFNNNFNLKDKKIYCFLLGLAGILVQS